MIKFALACDEGHGFESWFPDGAAYEKQARRGLIACPECGSTRVAKAIMAPAVVGAGRPERAPSAAAPVPVALIDERQRALREAVRSLRREIEAHTDDVGAKFPDIARAIHTGEAPERAIRGQASRAEVEALIEEGVGVLPMPTAPDELN
ncbi:MAG: DUF1178 family protein [Roseiarcus sp.]|jgi:hypothetical protein